MEAAKLLIEAIPAFADNYIWLLSRQGYGGCAVVDPGQSAQVINIFQTRDLNLDAILITHRHPDHIGGIDKLKQLWPQARVYGPKNESIKALEQRLQQGDQVTLSGLNVTFEVLDVPGHTEGQIAYYTPGTLFCGDALFAGGCGNVAGGTHEQFSESLQKIARLPSDTKVYCAHEYTQDNLGFAQWVEPNNLDLLQRAKEVKAQRLRGEYTVPSLLSDELATNPFLRTDQPQVIAAAERWANKALPEGSDVFRAIRTWKDTEYD